MDFSDYQGIYVVAETRDGKCLFKTFGGGGEEGSGNIGGGGVKEKEKKEMLYNVFLIHT